MIVLLLGGAGSGKSLLGERRAATLPAPVTYVATWVRTDEDPDMEERVAAHRDRRPAAWALREVGPGPELAECLAAVRGTMLVDALGTWVAGFAGAPVPVAEVCRALCERDGDTVVVSDEVGLGVHPTGSVGRHFRDVLGAVNQAVAAVADEAWLVVAGRPVALARAPW